MEKREKIEKAYSFFKKICSTNFAREILLEFQHCVYKMTRKFFLCFKEYLNFLDVLKQTNLL